MASCKHLIWDVDRHNVETCRLCGVVRDCQPAIDKSLGNAGLERPLRKGVYLDSFFSVMQGRENYYMQGSLPLDLEHRLRYNESI